MSSYVKFRTSRSILNDASAGRGGYTLPETRASMIVSSLLFTLTRKRTLACIGPLIPLRRFLVSSVCLKCGHLDSLTDEMPASAMSAEVMIPGFVPLIGKYSAGATFAQMKRSPSGPTLFARFLNRQQEWKKKNSGPTTREIDMDQIRGKIARQMSRISLYHMGWKL